jgi:hypothetical protein
MVGRSDPNYAAWIEYCARVDEAIARAHADFMARKSRGEIPDPESEAECHRKIFDAMVTMQLRLVTDHQLAESCVQELEKCSQEYLAQFRKWISAYIPQSARTAAQETLARLELDLLERLKRASADANKAALEAPTKPKRLKTATVTDKNLAARLRKHLESEGITQTYLASIVGPGISAKTLQRFLRNGTVSRDVFDCIARAMENVATGLERPHE